MTLFPRDSVIAKSFFVRTFIAKDLMELQPEERVSLPAWAMWSLYAGPDNDRLAKLHEKQFRAGLTAGMVLLTIKWMDWAGVEKPSVNKAVRIIEDTATGARAQKLAPGISSDRKEIRSDWKEMQPVAHLWAAHLLMSIDGTLANAPLERQFRLAYEFQEFGCQFRESHTKEKNLLLDAGVLFSVPVEFCQSTGLCEASFEAHPLLGDWIVAPLLRYKAPQSI